MACGPRFRKHIQRGATISFRQTFGKARFVRGMYDAGAPPSRASYIGSLRGEPFGRHDDMIRSPSLGLVRCNDIAVAPLSKLCRNTNPLPGLKRAVRLNARNRYHLSIDETEPFVVCTN
jgi:hypothetical protein